ncbi:GNAT family N-acetyltransferase [Nodularia chucula]|uniref:GNAT family N-acetyltransferase n=1 Tax=Nodularia chucula TaxID=3093667 RepID=UPI0039C74801
MSLVKITTYYLEMLNPEQLCSVPPGDYPLRIEQVKIPSPEFNRFFYRSVGGDWYWVDRLNWNYEHWLTYLERPELETWVAYCSGTPFGYLELELQPNNNVEIVYFGILKQFIGKRLGGHLLSVGVERAWAMGAKRLWLRTCSLDSPHALTNYQSRGFQIYKTEVHTRDMPDNPLGPWLGAYN